MSCVIKNPANIDLTTLGPHVDGLYSHFAQKYGFKKPPTMVFDSDPNNKANVLGKTAYYDPSSLEIHVYTDGRHPKDMLRSIAHELIHHRQNLEGRLSVGGYHGEGYYLKNKELKKLEQEAMKDGNETLREYEDDLKIKRNETMSLKEWKNNELNQLLLKKFGILKESVKNIEELSAREDQAEDRLQSGEANGREQGRLHEKELEEGAEPDCLDLNKDGDKEESMEQAAEDDEEVVSESIEEIVKENRKLRLRVK